MDEKQKLIVRLTEILKNVKEIEEKRFKSLSPFYKMIEKSTGIKVVSVPKDREPTIASVRKFEMELDAQIKENDAMRHRSILNADKNV